MTSIEKKPTTSDNDDLEDLNEDLPETNGGGLFKSSNNLFIVICLTVCIVIIILYILYLHVYYNFTKKGTEKVKPSGIAPVGGNVSKSVGLFPEPNANTANPNVANIVNTANPNTVNSLDRFTTYDKKRNVKPARKDEDSVISSNPPEQKNSKESVIFNDVNTEDNVTTSILGDTENEENPHMLLGGNDDNDSLKQMFQQIDNPDA